MAQPNSPFVRQYPLLSAAFALSCLVPLVLLSDCPVRFSFLTHAKLKMLTWSGHEAERAEQGSEEWGELNSFAICMNYKRHTFPARVAAPVPPPIPAPPAAAAPLAALLLRLCSALLYAPFPFPLSTCWVFSVCPAQLSHPSPCLPFPLCTPFSLVIVVLLFSACTAAVVAVIWIVGLRYSR